MKKKEREDFDDLIDRLVKSISLRHPQQKIDDEFVLKMSNAWRFKHKELYKMVKQLEINQNKVKSIENSFDNRVVTFQIGVDVLGNPIYHEHKVSFIKEFKDPKGYSKQGTKINIKKNRCFASQVTYVVPN